jgi:hypothetical protein
VLYCTAASEASCERMRVDRFCSSRSFPGSGSTEP